MKHKVSIRNGRLDLRDAAMQLGLDPDGPMPAELPECWWAECSCGWCEGPFTDTNLPDGYSGQKEALEVAEAHDRQYNGDSHGT